MMVAPRMNATLRIKDLSIHERPRERLVALGADALSDADLVAILLRTGLEGRSALAVAHDLLSAFGSLQRLASASVDDLRRTRGVGPDKAVALKAAFTLAQRMVREVQREAPSMDTPDRVADLLREEARSAPVEQFHVLLLNTRRRLIRVERLSQGTLDTILIHAREVFRSAIAANAAAIVLAHNHPSGDPTPSESDIRVTRDLVRAGQLLKIEVLDHIILGQRTEGRPRDFVSLRELGYFYA